jgi:hypothetical protein
LSNIVDNKDVEDIKNFVYYKNDLSTLDKRLKVENLRTLMVFGEHHGSFAKTFCGLFEKARALRTIYLSGASYTVEDMCCNLSKLIHLRYLRIKSVYMGKLAVNLSALSRLYHLEVIDLQECKGCYGFTRHMSNIAKLRHFVVPNYPQFHSNIFEVGKLKDNVSGGNRITYANLETLNQDHRMLIQGAHCNSYGDLKLGKKARVLN